MNKPLSPTLPKRMRRLRGTPSVRTMLQETHVKPSDLIAPLFVHDQAGVLHPVSSMPGVFRRTPNQIVKESAELHALGVRAVALFPCLDAKHKDPAGNEALNPETLILQTIRLLKREVPGLLIVADVALDPYTSHGHDGVLDPDSGDVDNDRTVAILARMAVLQAEAGADWVAPSDMMDGRVGAIRNALDAAGRCGTSILSYAAKFASAYYGPFRDAVGSKQAAGGAYLDKRTYQLSPANRREALSDALLDEVEGADFLMVKPAGPYLDIIRDLRERTRMPLVAYQVSGEYAQLHAASRLGWLDLKKCRDESLLAIKRAGADLIITYFARDFCQDQQSTGTAPLAGKRPRGTAARDRTQLK